MYSFIFKRHYSMRKTLLKNYIHIPETNSCKSKEYTPGLHELLQELKPQLSKAANDLVSPRPELMTKLLNKVLH